MRKRQDKIQEEVRKTMESLDHFQPLEGNPYLYTRIKQRMENQTTAPFAPLLSWWQPLAFTLLLSFEIVSWYSFNSVGSTSTEKHS